MHKILFYILISGLFLKTVCCFISDEDNTLQLVHILFRHGTRTVDPITMYPNNPHINETFYPIGPNELTLDGKTQMYKLGKVLRNRYNRFLGPQYTPDLIEATASYYNRSKTSLQIVLASLFPPLEQEIFEPGLNWQPIPFTHEQENNRNFFVASENCPNFLKELDMYSNTPAVKQELEKDKNIFDYISLNSGQSIKNYYDMISITNLLAVEQELGLSPPEWVMKIDSSVLLNLRDKAYSMVSATKELTKITAGAILEKIINDSLKKVNNNKKKLLIYSGHDITIVTLLRALKIYDFEYPSYGANLLLELHKINTTYRFKLFYSNESSTEAKLLQIPGCETICSLKEFIFLTKEYIPDIHTCGQMLECSGSSQYFAEMTIWMTLLSLLFVY